MKIFKKNSGFTLIELIVVISIIGVLAGIMVANFSQVRAKTRDGVRRKDMEQIRLALETYRSDAAQYPTLANFPACGSPLTYTPPGASSSSPNTYMKKVPCDPKGTAYTYTPTTNSAGKILGYTLSICIENENDQSDIVVDDTTCTVSKKKYVIENP